MCTSNDPAHIKGSISTFRVFIGMQYYTLAAVWVSGDKTKSFSTEQNYRVMCQILNAVSLHLIQ